MQPRHEDEINLLSMMSLEAYLPGDRFKETEAIKAGAKSDTVQGKYYPKIMFRKATASMSVNMTLWQTIRTT